MIHIQTGVTQFVPDRSQGLRWRIAQSEHRSNVLVAPTCLLSPRNVRGPTNPNLSDEKPYFALILKAMHPCQASKTGEGILDFPNIHFINARQICSRYPMAIEKPENGDISRAICFIAYKVFQTIR